MLSMYQGVVLECTKSCMTHTVDKWVYLTIIKSYALPICHNWWESYEERTTLIYMGQKKITSSSSRWMISKHGWQSNISWSDTMIHQVIMVLTWRLIWTLPSNNLWLAKIIKKLHCPKMFRPSAFIYNKHRITLFQTWREQVRLNAL